MLATAERIKEYLDGAVPSIPEPEEPVLPMKVCSAGNPYVDKKTWASMVTACIL